MKSSKTATLIATVLGLSGLALAPAALSAPGNGWDIFNSGDGDRIHASAAYVGTAMGGSAGQGYDLFGGGDGVPLSDIRSDYVATSMSDNAGQGWDLFHSGEGQKL